MDRKAMREIETWWNVSESAEYIGISRQAFYPYILDGRVRAVQTRCGWLCDPQAVRDLERRRGRETAAQRERRATQYINDLDHGAPR